MKYQKKPVEIEAIQYTGENLEDLRNFVPNEWRDNRINQPLGIKTLEGVMTISEGDYVIKGVKGEFYPCKPDIFEITYEKVEEKWFEVYYQFKRNNPARCEQLFRCKKDFLTEYEYEEDEFEWIKLVELKMEDKDGSR